MFSEVVSPSKVLSNGLTFFHYFAQKNMGQNIRICLKHGIDINIRTSEEVEGVPKESTALLVAYHSKQYEMCKMLINFGADVNM